MRRLRRPDATLGPSLALWCSPKDGTTRPRYVCACQSAYKHAVTQDSPFGYDRSLAGRRGGVVGSGGAVDHALDFAAVDAEFAGYGALAAARLVPGSYRLLHCWCTSWIGWCAVLY